MGSRKAFEVGADGKLQGIGIHDPRVQHANLREVGGGSNDSDFTEQGVRAGVPEPSGRSNMALKASGGQTARTSYTVRARAAGHPIPSDGSFIWYDDNNDEAQNKPYGHDGYQVITGCNMAIQGKDTTDAYTRPDIIRLHNDQLLVAYMSGAKTAFLTQLYDPQTGLWQGSTQTVAGNLGQESNVALFALPSGRVVALFSDGDTQAQVHAICSDDNGGSWQNYASSCLENKSADEITGMSVSYSAGVVLLFTQEENASRVVTMEQWVSYDLGCNFERVGSDFYSATAAATSEEPYSVCVEGLDNGAFLVSYADKGSGIGAGKAKYRVGVIDPAQPAYSQNLSYVANSINGTDTSECEEAIANVWVWRDEDRTCYMFANHGSGSAALTSIYRSEDGGESWLAYECAGAFWCLYYHPSKFCINSVGGRAVMVTFIEKSQDGETSDGFAESNRLFWIYYGGHARQTAPGYQNGLQQFDPTDMVGWSRERGTLGLGSNFRLGYAWLSFADPGNCGWTAASSGSESYGFDATTGSMVVDTNAGARYWRMTQTPGVKEVEHVAFAMKLKVTSGGSRSSLQCGVQVRATNYNTSGTIAATAHHAVQVCCATTGFTVLDQTGTPVISIDTDMTKDTWIWVSVKCNPAAGNNGEVAVFYGKDAEDPSGSGGLGTQRRALTLAGTVGSLHNDAAASPSEVPEIQWGHVSTGLCTSYWQFAGWTAGAGPWTSRVGGTHDSYVKDWTGAIDTDPKTAMCSLNGREWSTVPALLIDQVRMSAGDGPGKHDDKWVIKPKFDFGIENLDILNNASPRLPWRSAQETAGAAMTHQRLVWDMESSSPSQEVEFGNYAIIVMLLNCNFKDAKLQEWDHSGSAWQDICDLDASVDMTGMSFQRRGACITPYPSASGSAPKWIHRSSLVGSTLDLGAGGGLVQYKHIRANTEGGWHVDGTGTIHTRVPRIYYETGELNSSDANSGTCAIWRKNFGCILLNKASNNIDQTISLYLPAQANADGYFQIGSVLIGEVAVFGHQFDRGLSWTTRPNVQDYSRPDGTRRPHILGPVRRAVEFSWSETAVDASSIQGGFSAANETLPSSNSPEWVAGTAGGNYPVASTRDAVSLMEGILREVNGSSQPVAFLPRIPLKAGHAQESIQFNDDRMFLYGRIDSDHSYSVVQGNEGADEVQRLNKITITEEV